MGFESERGGRRPLTRPLDDNYLPSDLGKAAGEPEFHRVQQKNGPKPAIDYLIDPAYWISQKNRFGRNF